VKIRDREEPVDRLSPILPAMPSHGALEEMLVERKCSISSTIRENTQVTVNDRVCVAVVKVAKYENANKKLSRDHWRRT